MESTSTHIIPPKLRPDGHLVLICRHGINGSIFKLLEGTELDGQQRCTVASMTAHGLFTRFMDTDRQTTSLASLQGTWIQTHHLAC